MSQEDEFYCGSEESDETKDRRRNALEEAIDRALRRTDHACGTEQNPHVIEVLEEGLTSFDLTRIKLTGTLWRCKKCKSYPALPFMRISRLTIELVED